MIEVIDFSFANGLIVTFMTKLDDSMTEKQTFFYPKADMKEPRIKIPHPRTTKAKLFIPKFPEAYGPNAEMILWDPKSPHLPLPKQLGHLVPLLTLKNHFNIDYSEEKLASLEATRKRKIRREYSNQNRCSGGDSTFKNETIRKLKEAVVEHKRKLENEETLNKNLKKVPAQVIRVQSLPLKTKKPIKFGIAKIKPIELGTEKDGRKEEEAKDDNDALIEDMKF